jgi:hypothetical protein
MREGIYLILGAYILGFWGAAFGETFETFRGIQWPRGTLVLKKLDKIERMI